MQLYVIMFVSDLWQVGGYILVFRFSPSIKLKVALNTITLTRNPSETQISNFLQVLSYIFLFFCCCLLFLYILAVISYVFFYVEFIFISTKQIIKTKWHHMILDSICILYIKCISEKDKLDIRILVAGKINYHTRH
jgi:hypothetical protein